jgi:ArsR family transcriptional regulator
MLYRRLSEPFSDNTRLRILYLLSESELCVGDLAIILEVTPSGVSHQLRGLRALRLVKARRDGRNSFYSVADDHVRSLLQVGLEHVREKKSS